MEVINGPSIRRLGNYTSLQRLRNQIKVIEHSNKVRGNYLPKVDNSFISKSIFPSVFIHIFAGIHVRIALTIFSCKTVSINFLENLNFFKVTRRLFMTLRLFWVE